MKSKYTLFAFKLFLLIVICGTILNTKEVFAGNNQYYLVDMENPTFPNSGWTVSNTSGYDWVRTTLCSGYGTGVSSVCCDFYDYASGNFDLISPTLINTVGGDQLIFDHAYASGAGEVDRLDVYTSTNGGTTWTLLISLSGGASGPLATSSPTEHLFVPTSSQWATKTYSLPTGTNKIKFEGVTAYGNNLYLDNIKIGTRTNTDVGANAIYSPKWGITQGSVAPVGSVRNFGNNAQTFQVTLTINPGGYSNTQTVTNLAAGTTQNVTFANYNFASNGTYTLKEYTTLAGDLFHNNDTISATVVVTPSPRNVTLEYCTGTWCQWCPCGDNLASLLATTYPNSVILAYHGAGTDPWRIFNGSNIINLLGFNGYPEGLIDRRLGNNYSWGSFFTDGEYRLSQAPSGTCNIVLTNLSYNGGTRSLTVNIDATALQDLTGQYKITYYVAESNLIYPQTGNGYCPGSGSWVHNNVVRNIVNGAVGENLNTGNWNNGQTISKSFTTTLDSTWVATNCKVSIVVYKDNGTFNVSEIQQGTTSSYLTPIGIINQNTQIPSKYELKQNYPNPFNPTTNVHFSIPKDGNATLKIYNTLGQEVGVYLDGFIKAGNYNAEIDASNLASGVYFYTLRAGDFVETKKMMFVK